MGQYWNIINLDMQENVCSIHTKLGDSFWEDQSHLYTMLTPAKFPKAVTDMLEEGNFSLQPGPLGKLSVEVLQMIFAQLHEFGQIVVLSITCKMMLAAGMPALREAYQKKHRSWIGCRMICIGDYASNEKLPAGLLTDEERQELETTLSWKFREETHPSTLYMAALDYRNSSLHVHDADMLRETSFLGPRYERRDDLWESVANSTLLHDTFRIRKLYQDAESMTFSDGDTEVLCNLSKSEYFRVNATGLRIGSAPDVGHTLFSQICWSDDYSCGMDIPDSIAKELVQGAWAGDRFCVATLENMPKGPRTGQPWTDVTERINDFSERLWRGRFQPDYDETAEEDDTETDEEEDPDSDEDSYVEETEAGVDGGTEAGEE